LSAALSLEPRRTFDGYVVENVVRIKDIRNAVTKDDEFARRIGHFVKPVWPSNPDVIASGGFKQEDSEWPQPQLMLNLLSINHVAVIDCYILLL
jgi:hypothetical protein